MRTDYFDDLLPDSVTHVTQPETKRVTPETGKAASENSELSETLRTLRTLRTETGNTQQNEAITEHLEERAAIQEYDGGLTRKQAEKEARRALRVYRYRLSDCPDSDLILIAPDTNLTEATEGLRQRYSERLLGVWEYSIKGMATRSN